VSEPRRSLKTLAVDAARSAALWAGFAGVAMLAFPPMVLGYPLVLVDPNRALSDAWLRTLARAMVGLNPKWRVHVEGREHLEHGGPFVLVVNHQSLFDLMVTSFLRHPTKYLGKASAFRVPVLGWGLRIAGQVPVDRGDPESRREAVEELRRWLGRGVSVCLFPEGTRSEDGRIAPFKLGAFRLAVESGRPVVPIVLAGARDLLPKHSVLFQREANLSIVVLPPVPTAGVTDPQALADRVRDDMVRTLERLEAR
jgi:1-acyl-sn-glycerol-3-phosphate acyltransferase